jgi:hypothetical protein
LLYQDDAAPPPTLALTPIMHHLLLRVAPEVNVFGGSGGVSIQTISR